MQKNKERREGGGLIIFIREAEKSFKKVYGPP
jgi:hypothetical protein